MGKRLSLEECKEFAKSKGGKCISVDYFNMKTQMKWQCEHGHKWEATFDGIKHNNTWCPHCANNLKHSLEECKEFAKSKGGKCLSKEYIDNKTKMKWQCEHGHKWETSFAHIKNSESWCPYCANNIKLKLEECKEFAKSKGGKCLSTEYTGNKDRMKWQCEHGHIWEANFNSIKSKKSWCPHCYNQSINKGVCINENYIKNSR